MKTYRTADDVSKDKEIEERTRIKGMIINDVNEVEAGIFPKKIQEEVKKIKRKFSVLKWMGLSLLFLFMITLILCFIFLIKIFVTGIF